MISYAPVGAVDSGREWINSALVTQALLGIYLQVVEWVPLGRWNNVANGNGQAGTDVVLGLLQLFFLLVYWKRWRWLMVAGVILYGLWLYMEISSWWIPYFSGASPQMMQFYEHWFANTYKFLPRIADHPIPDAEHTVILLLLVVVLTCSIRSTLQALGTKPRRA